MPIWSLTKERVEKLLTQIRDMEFEIDTLIKLSREDLWSKDLDEFINEWRTQLEEEANLRKKIASLGRRASSKLNINAKVPKRQRKAQGEDPDDSDFGTKAGARKAAPVKRAQSKSTMLSPLAPLAKPTVTKKPTATSKAKAMTLGTKSSSSISEDKMPSQPINDAVSSFESAPTSDLAVAPIFQKAKAAAVSKKKAPAQKETSEDEDDYVGDEDMIRPIASRKPREAAKKVPTYNLDDSDSNGDDMLLDVGKMVKGIGNASSDQATTTRPLFSTSMSRPGSSAGLPKKSSSLAKQPMEIDGDDTDYSKLAPPPAAKRGISVTARRTVISDDDDDDDDVDDDDDDEILPVSRKPAPAKVASTSKAPKTVAAKPATKAKAKESVIASTKSSTKQPVSQPLKKMPLSPAAKAYAAKRAKSNPVLLDVDSDDEEDEVDRVANAILGDDNGKEELENEAEEDEPAVRRPARRAAAQAAAKVTKGWGDESEEEDDEDDEVEDEDDEDNETFDEEDSE